MATGVSDKPIELLSPAGSFETALAAFAAGADAVYLGLSAFSARAEAVNLSEDELRLVLAKARADGKAVYVTFNTLVDAAQMPEAIERLTVLSELQVDGVIVQDLGVARIVRRHFPNLALHASTQLVAHNLEGVLALKDLGFGRVVLARELSLADIRSIVRRSGVEIEVFVHGALCYSISGLCLFSALERERSGNRGRCAYCCRLSYDDAAGRRGLPFSMKDLRLDDHLDALREAGVASLKIEGRMKSPLYVASVTRRYRDLLDTGVSSTTRADLETVFSRRTTSLYVDGYRDASAWPDAVDPLSLGHLGTAVGTVKRLTKDREGRTWLRFHTSRALARHDGLQFADPNGGKPAGFGISEMRTALSRRGAFEVAAGEDVEILVPAARPGEKPLAIEPGMTVYCSASNDVRRRFPVPAFRPADVAAGTPVDVTVTLAPDALHARGAAPGGVCAEATVALAATAARQSERTFSAVERAFARLGTTDWRLGRLAVQDPDRLFAPASSLNALRRALVDSLDAARLATRRARVDAACAEALPHVEGTAVRAADAPFGAVLKRRLDQAVLPGAWAEEVVAIGHSSDVPAALPVTARLAVPVFTREGDFAALRTRVKGLVRRGFAKWEAADLATLRLLRACGVTDLTADWSLYAFNPPAVAQLAELGVSRFVCSPENGPANLRDLQACCRDSMPIVPEFLVRQATPLFISLTRPAAERPERLTGLRSDVFASYCRDGLWVTTRPEPRIFSAPEGGIRRTDISWDVS